MCRRCLRAQSEVSGNDALTEETTMYNLTNEDLLLAMHHARSRELRQAAAEARLLNSLPRTRHGTGRSWLRRRHGDAPAS